MGKIIQYFKNNRQIVTITVLWLALALFFSLTTTGFATPNNIFNLLRQVAIMALLSVGMTAVVCSGGIDLSLGGQVTIVSVVIAKVNADFGVNIWISLLIGLLVGCFIGFLNGLVFVTTHVVPMVTTLAMSTILQGLAYTLTDAKTIYGVDPSILVFGQGYIGVIPVPVIIAIIIMIIGAFVFRKTYMGRYFYAVGSNEEAARLSGLDVRKIRLTAYILCGLLAGISGIVMTSRLNSGNPACGDGLEMDVLTAIVVGGVSLAGGKGSMMGVTIGVLLMGTLTNGLGVMGVSSYNQKIAEGAVLLVVVIIDGLRTVLAERSFLRQKPNNKIEA